MSIDMAQIQQRRHHYIQGERRTDQGRNVQGSADRAAYHEGRQWTGATYTTPLVHTRHGDRYVVISSKGGTPTNPCGVQEIGSDHAA